MVYCDSASMTRFIYVRDGQVSDLECSVQSDWSYHLQLVPGDISTDFWSRSATIHSPWLWCRSAARLLIVRAHTNRSTSLECPARTASHCSRTYQPVWNVRPARLPIVRAHTNRPGMSGPHGFPLFAHIPTCPITSRCVVRPTVRILQPSALLFIVRGYGTGQPHGFSLFAYIPTGASVWNGRPSDPFMLGFCTF